MNSDVNLGKFGTYLSAYGIAVKHGFQGTEQDWLCALKGAVGESVELLFDKEKNTLCYKTPSQSRWQELIPLADLQSEIQDAGLREMESLLASARQQAQAAEIAGNGANAAVAAAQAAKTETAAQAASALLANTAAQQAAAHTAEIAQNVEAQAQNMHVQLREAQAAAETAAAASNAVQNACGTAGTARDEAQNAKTEAVQAAGRAQVYGSDSATSAALAKSWARGGTGTRDGEDADNARYWANLAVNASDVGAHAANITVSELGVHGIRCHEGIVQCLENGNWVNAGVPGGKKALVVGTVKSGHSANDCDFLCTGAADETVIQKALEKSGGALCFLAGEYVFNASITLQDAHVQISGAGTKTVFKRNFSGSMVKINGFWVSVGLLHTGAGCQELVLSDLVMDGNVDHYAGEKNACVSGEAGRINLRRVTLRHTAVGFSTAGAFCAADTVFMNVQSSGAAKTTRVSGCLVENSRIGGNDCDAEGNRFVNASLYPKGECRIVGNSFTDAEEVGVMASDVKHILCTGNIFRNCTVALYGDYIECGKISENIFRDNASGILLVICRLCDLHGNTVYRGTGKTEDYTEEHITVRLEQCRYCTIWNNILPGKDAVDLRGIGNTFTGNHAAPTI